MSDPNRSAILLAPAGSPGCPSVKARVRYFNELIPLPATDDTLLSGVVSARCDSGNAVKSLEVLRIFYYFKPSFPAASGSFTLETKT